MLQNSTLSSLLAELDLAPGEPLLFAGAQFTRDPQHAGQTAGKFPNHVDLLRPAAAWPPHAANSGTQGIAVIETLSPTASYGVACLAPDVGQLIQDLGALVTVCADAIRPGGYIVALGILPDTPDRAAYGQIPVSALQAFFTHFTFDEPGNAAGVSEFATVTVHLPALHRFDLMSIHPVDQAGAGPLAWYVFTKRSSDDDNAGHGRTWSQAFRDQASTFATHAKRFGPEDYGALLPTLGMIEPPSELRSMLHAQPFDALMYVHNEFERDSRVMKTAEAIKNMGLRLLAVGVQGINGEFEFEYKTIFGSVPLILLPNHNRAVWRAIEAAGLSLDQGPRYELRLAMSAGYVAAVISELETGSQPFVLHSHDFTGLYVAGNARDLLQRSASQKKIKWIHDIHEYVQGYDIIDPTLQALGCRWEAHYYRTADNLTTVSGELSSRLTTHYDLPAMGIIYNCNKIAVRHKYRGEPLRTKFGLGAEPVLVHSGSIRPGRGVDHLIGALPAIPEARLLLLTGKLSDYTEGLLELAASLGVRDRILVHPLLPYDEVASFIADADVGMITHESYGNADVSLPNKLFDYLLAELPIVCARTTTLAQLLADWPVGQTFEPGNVAELAAATNAVIADRQQHVEALLRRSDILMSFAWETQALKLRQIYLGGSDSIAANTFTPALPEY